MSEPAPVPLAIVVPEELEAGVYSNVVNIWHTDTEFTLDFLVRVPGATPVELPDGTRAPGQRLRAVARVRLPPAQIFEVMKALEQQLSAFEAEQQGRPPAGDEF
ncbi:MAG TPA: DUF3467 domain-containing protein [Mycobacteriales bacterium]|jgi:hypothetical protein|nr:DUF3467 domain-containing protein [Mycobacteriales bacterium]